MEHLRFTIYDCVYVKEATFSSLSDKNFWKLTFTLSLLLASILKLADQMFTILNSQMKWLENFYILNIAYPLSTNLLTDIKTFEITYYKTYFNFPGQRRKIRENLPAPWSEIGAN